jgi:viroplasmin and RNaseH domain-containing protein
MIIEIPDKLTEMGETNLLLTPKAEEALYLMETVFKSLEEARKQVRENLKAAIEAENPSISSIKGDKVTVYFKSYGEKYFISGECDPRFTKSETKVKVVSEDVEAFMKEHGGLPVGISEADRTRNVEIRVKQ